MKIAVLTHNMSPYSQRRFTEAGKLRNHKIFFIQLSHCYMNLSTQAPVVYYHDAESLNKLEAIIPRINPSHTFYGTAVLRQFERMKVYTLNSSLAIIWSRDKIRALQQLARCDLPLPITGIADTPAESEKLIELVGGAPLIVRLLEGTEGKGTIFAETNIAALSVINAFKQLKANILVQESIQEAEGQDIRCVVIGNKVAAAVQRKIEEPKSKSRKEILSHTQAVDITEEEREIAIKAAKSLNLNLASVDLIRSKRGPLLLDVNPSPNIEMLETATKIDIAGLILEFIETNAKKHD